MRHLGVLTPIAVLRLQVGLRLLDGSTAGMDDRTIALLLAAEHHAQNTADDPDEGPDDTGDDGPGDDGPDDGPGDDGPDDGLGRRARMTARTTAAPTTSALAGPALHRVAPTTPGQLTTTPSRPFLAALTVGAGRPRPPRPPRPAGRSRTRGAARPARHRPGPDPGRLRRGPAPVTTALGLDEHPGSVPGYGAVLAGDARSLALRHRDGEWRVVLTDDQGRLQHVLLARRRPRRPPGPRGRHRARGRRASIVELQVPTTLLAALDPDDHPDWAPLLRELQQRLADLDGPGAPPDHNAGPDDRARRRPGAELDRWIRVRDRHCVAPWCRRPAHKADLDHTLAHARGGPTSSWNLGAWCTHDHRAKHHADWTVRQPRPGRFVIRTRAGITYTRHPKRITDPLPAPRPAAAPRPLPDDGWVDDRTDDIDPDWFQEATEKTRPTPTTPIRTSYDGDPPF